MFPPLVCACVFVGAAVRAKLCPREQKGKDQNRGRKKKRKAGRSFYPLNLETITATFEGHTGIFVCLQFPDACPFTGFSSFTGLRQRRSASCPGQLHVARRQTFSLVWSALLAAAAALISLDLSDSGHWCSRPKLNPNQVRTFYIGKSLGYRPINTFINACIALLSSYSVDLPIKLLIVNLKPGWFRREIFKMDLRGFRSACPSGCKTTVSIL